MKIYLDCYPCFLRQAIDAVQFAGATEGQTLQVLQSVLQTLHDMEQGANPAEIARLVHRAVRETLNVRDPYIEQKKHSTRKALELLPKYRDMATRADDLEPLIRLAIAGNIMDFGMFRELKDLEATATRVLSQPFAIDHTKALIKRIRASGSVLYLADNAGETVFDRLLIESLPVPVTYVVKGHPILNDATMADALDAGQNQYATLMDNGSDAPGTVLHTCSRRFRTVFNDAEVVIAKGQANYESLSDAGDNVFCLLQVKCPVIADDMGVPVNSIVVRQNPSET